jgi:hypothetical protein
MIKFRLLYVVIMEDQEDDTPLNKLTADKCRLRGLYYMFKDPEFKEYTQYFKNKISEAEDILKNIYGYVENKEDYYEKLLKEIHYLLSNDLLNYRKFNAEYSDIIEKIHQQTLEVLSPLFKYQYHQTDDSATILVTYDCIGKFTKQIITPYIRYV